MVTVLLFASIASPASIWFVFAFWRRQQRLGQTPWFDRISGRGFGWWLGISFLLLALFGWPNGKTYGLLSGTFIWQVVPTLSLYVIVMTLVDMSSNVAAWLWLCEPIVGRSTFSARLRPVRAVMATWAVSSTLFALTRGSILGWLGGVQMVGTDLLIVLSIALLFAWYRSIRRPEAVAT